MTRDEFERQFDSRTVLYADTYRPDPRPVVVGFGPDIHTPAGHLLLTALCNLLARAHRRIALVGDLTGGLLCGDAFSSRRLEAATAGLITAIHPFRDVVVTARVPDCDPLLRIGLGCVAGSWDVRVGARGWMADFGTAAETIEPDALWGAALAACLAANCAFQRQLDRPVAIDGTFNLWERGAPGGAQGPAPAPVDVGRVLQAGVGGVGSAVDYWLALVGVAGSWLLVDGDSVSIDNLNRQVYFLASDTVYAGSARNKAQTVAARMGPVVEADPHWYGTTDATVEGSYDLVLALANEYGVRAALQARGDALLLHATTSRSWQAQLHRHILGVDDCILCRIPEPLARMTCSTGALAPRQPDAALPFLSATAGLLLAGEVSRLALSDRRQTEANFHSVILRRATPAVQGVRHRCQAGCPYGA